MVHFSESSKLRFQPRLTDSFNGVPRVDDSQLLGTSFGTVLLDKAPSTTRPSRRTQATGGNAPHFTNLVLVLQVGVAQN